MKHFALLALLALAAAGNAAPKAAPAKKLDPAFEWPAVRRETRPWTRWWWLGSALNEAEITRHLEEFKQAGLGGVEVSPIYGAQGAESGIVPYLSPRWVELLRHTTREARRLGLGVDMILGTGWPYGGPTVKGEDAASQMVLHELSPGATRLPVVRGARLEALMEFSANGQVTDSTAHVDPQGRLKFTVPPFESSAYSLQVRPTGQQVKRAGPGGEGPVLDPYSAPALQRWLAQFTAVFDGMPSAERPRAVFNDSFEAFGANWTPDLFAQFQHRRGYDLRRQLQALGGYGDPRESARVQSDYRQTVAELLLESFTRPWGAWARSRNCSTRNQAHGSPGNLLDLYAAADIPETEMFGPVGVRHVDEGDHRYTVEPLNDILTAKLASSAAHVAGKPYTSSESMTWLSEHFQGSLAEVKNQAHQQFLAGVNHLFFHGSPSSPADAAWPGWLFYASTHFAPTNTWWRDFGALNHYLARCQSFLQAGRPDNDVLVYFPIWDLWASPDGSRDLLQPMTVHTANIWREKNLPRFDQASRELWSRGCGFDYVSDDLLQQIVSVSDGQWIGRNGTYRVLLLAGCERMPPATLERVARFVREGATLAILDRPPSDIPGRSDLQARQAALQAALSSLGLPLEGSGIREARIGKGRVLVGPSVEFLTDAAKARSEWRTKFDGLTLMRRVHEGWTDYFIVNQGPYDYSGWAPLKTLARSVILFDPQTGERGLAALRRGFFADETEVQLELGKGEACVLRVLNREVRGPAWKYAGHYGKAHELKGEWGLEFLQGGPTLPPPLRTAKLKSWTDLPGDAAALRAFSGTARYRLTFDPPRWLTSPATLDLGEVHHTARVRLNGQDLGTLIGPQYRINLPKLRDRGNVLEIEVTNLMANRIAEMDRRKLPWQKFFFVNRDYKKFDASTWEPLPSGLLGPVRLLPHGIRSTQYDSPHSR